MRSLVLAGLLCSAAVPTLAQSGPKMFLFDALRRPDYRAAYEHMLRGERNLPSWMATAKAAEGSTDDPGTTAMIDGERELFEACEPHNCAGHVLVVMFSRFGLTSTKAVLSIDGATRFFGRPDAAERHALVESLPKS